MNIEKFYKIEPMRKLVKKIHAENELVRKDRSTLKEHTETAFWDKITVSQSLAHLSIKVSLFACSNLNGNVRSVLQLMRLPFKICYDFGCTLLTRDSTLYGYHASQAHAIKNGQKIICDKKDMDDFLGGIHMLGNVPPNSNAQLIELITKTQNANTKVYSVSNFNFGQIEYLDLFIDTDLALLKTWQSTDILA